MSAQAAGAEVQPAAGAAAVGRARRSRARHGTRLARRHERRVRRLYAACGVATLLALLVATVVVLDVVR